MIGLPGLLYLAARVSGLNAEVEASGLHSSWWRIPVLVLVAFANGFAEEVVVVGYLITRLRQLGLKPTEGRGSLQPAARVLPPVPRFRRRPGECRDGAGLRLRLVPDRPPLAVGDRARDHRHGRLRPATSLLAGHVDWLR